jgi:hypothetical protein
MEALQNFGWAFAILAFCLILTSRIYLWLAPKANCDPSLCFGLSGLITLGTLGTIFLFAGLISTIAIPIVAAAALVAAIVTPPGPRVLIEQFKSAKASYVENGPKGAEWLFIIPLKICAILALIGVLAPPDLATEWDSLAYHLAVPKMWMQAGHITYVPFIHQSNFPGAFDYLYLFGLLGGFAGAKAFIFATATFGGFAIFGLARQMYGRRAGWWAALTYATVPVVLWLGGTAYIDVPNGLCAGLGIGLAALYCQSLDKRHVWLAAVMLGLATASKYTGLQTIGAVGFVLLLVGLKRKQGGEFLKSAVVMGLLAIAIASPWYIKNVINTGNPVYPFFYSKLGGHNWSAPQAEEYSREQSSFGAPSGPRGWRDLPEIGHAVLGLAYQPGRYINPAQQAGGGQPMGAIGVTVICALLAWALSGRSRAFEIFNLAAIAVSLLMWFLLSQQSRYIVTLAVPLAVMLGGGVVRLRVGQWLAVIASLQAIYSIALVFGIRTESQVPVVVGLQSDKDYSLKHVDFDDAAAFINGYVPKTGRVALYDVVFGYLLDVPYYWANPGHSNEIPYAEMHNGHDFVLAMRKMGFTHLYVKLAQDVRPNAENRAWVAAMGLQGLPQPFPPEMQARYNMDSFEQKYVPLIADAVAHGEISPVKAFRTGILFEFTQQAP